MDESKVKRGQAIARLRVGNAEFTNKLEIKRRQSIGALSSSSQSKSDNDLLRRRTSLEPPIVTQSLPSFNVYAKENQVVTDYVINCPSPQIAREFSTALYENAVPHSGVDESPNGTTLQVAVENINRKEFEQAIKQTINPLMLLSTRLQELKHEAAALQKKCWLKQLWQGLPTKIAKINTLEHLIDRINQDTSLNAGQHCQAIRRRYPILGMGFFQHRTRDVLNIIENEARKPALDAYLARRSR